MNLLSDIVTYVRRLLKTPNNTTITDSLIIDYINRFWIMDVDARMQLFDLKTQYQFLTQPGVDRYNMPLYNMQTEPEGKIASYPVYQGFLGPAYVGGVQCQFYTLREQFDALWPNYQQTLVQVGTGNGSAGPYTLSLPFAQAFNNSINFPFTSGVIRGHMDMTGIIASGMNQDPPLDSSGFGSLIPTTPTTSILPAVYFNSTDATGANVTVCDSGIFLSSNVNTGLLMSPGNAPYGNTVLADGGGTTFNYTATQNTINYVTGIATNVYFPVAIPAGMPINASCIFFELGLPRAILFYNNTLTLRAPPQTQYVVSMTAYLSPAAFFSTSQAVPFGYMCEYIARGSARKILSDTGDWDQFDRYEPLFMEQELLVWKRSERIFTSTRTPTIYSQGPNGGSLNNNNFGLGIN